MSRAKELTEEQINEIKRLNQEGWSTKQIISIMGITKSQGYGAIRRMGLKSKSLKNGATPRERENIRELYQSGLTIRQIVEMFDNKYTEGFIGFIIKDISRPNGKAATLNHSYFREIDNEHKAYWLGFIYADGSVKQDKGKGKNGGWNLTMELKVTDKYILEQMCHDLESDKIPREYRVDSCRNGWKPKHNAKVTFFSKELCQDLIRWGAVPNKTHLLKELPTIPKDLMKHFIRGYFDGDGTIYINSESNKIRTAFYGTHDYIESIQSYLNEELGLSRKKVIDQKQAKVSFISFAYQESLILCEWLYSDATIYLTRKHDIFINNRDN